MEVQWLKSSTSLQCIFIWHVECFIKVLLVMGNVTVHFRAGKTCSSSPFDQPLSCAKTARSCAISADAHVAPRSGARVALRLLDKWEWRWHCSQKQPLSGRFVISVTELLCHWLPRQSCWHRVSEAMVPGWVHHEPGSETPAPHLTHPVRTYTGSLRSFVGDIFKPPGHQGLLLEGRMTPAHLMISCC